MAFFKVMVLVMVAAVTSKAEPQGQPYLPPKQGYTYPTPIVPFPDNTIRPVTKYPITNVPTNRPHTNPPITYRPITNPPITYRPITNTNRPNTVPIVTNRPTTHVTYTPDESNIYNENEHLNHPHVAGKPYNFNYAVKDDYYGTDYSRNEVSDGDVITGEYRVLLPDGRLQVVRYTADWKTGYHADVSYEGQAQYPQATNQGPNQGSNQGPYQAPSGPAPAYGVPVSGGNRGGY